MSSLKLNLLSQDMLMNQVREGLQKQLYFNQHCLNPDDPKCTPDEYFKEISYQVDLEGNSHLFHPLLDLYKVLDTCYYHDEMKYCPILLEIGAERIRKAYNNAKYLLQVWDMNQNKVYEHSLQSPFKNWAICYRYFVYTLEEGNEDDQYLFVVDLEDGNKKVKVQNFGQGREIKYLSYNNGLLFAASDSSVQVVSLPTDQLTNEGKVYNASEKAIKTITPGVAVHGFILNIHCVNDKYQLVALETSDNQLDFNKLYVYNINDAENYTYKWEQYREVVPRSEEHKPNSDPIRKNKFVFSKGFNYTLSLRASGKFDLYWNMTRKDSPQSKYALDVEMSVSYFYLKMLDGNIYGFNHRNQNYPQFAMAEKIPADEIDWHRIHIKKVQNIVNLFTGIHIVRIGITMCVITHSKFVSIFDLTDWKWVNHVEFEDDIVKLFRHYKTADSRYQTILCKNGAIYIGVLNYDEYTEPVPTSKRNLQINGTVIRCNEDIENNHTFYVTVKEGAEFKLQVMYRGKLSYVKEVQKGAENLNAACLQVRGDDSHVVIQNGAKYALYKQGNNNGDLKLTLIKQYTDMPEIKGNLHSGTSYNVNDHVLLFDEKNLYVIKNTNPQKTKTYPNVYCVGFQNFTKSFNYAICQETPDSVNPGLRLFDMESIVKNIDKTECFFMLLKKIDIGTQGYFEFGANVVRFAFIQSLTHIIIPPILHRNMNKFMGIKDTSEYICYKIIKDKFLAMNNKGEISCWNILTGKLLGINKVEGHDYSGYELVSKYKRNAVLLRSKEKLEGINDEQFFLPWQYKTHIENQNSFIKTTSYTIKRWINLEIKNEKEVQINLEYIHPSYAKEWIFINDKKDRMVVVLTNYRTYVYKAVKETADGESSASKIRWEVIRQIGDYPGELENDAQRLEFFSPDFSRYIILDKKLQQFKIKDTYTDQVLFTVPKDLMPYNKGDDPSKVINRFKFQDAKTFIIVNEIGLEKKINIDNGFEELQFNYRPLFNEKDNQDWKTKHYYVLRSELTTNQVLERLKRMYQTYKTAYFLHEKRDIHVLYEDLITVDDNKFDFSEHSFTYLHWSLIEQIKKGEIKVKQLEEPVIQQILYNILPGGNTVLHMLCKQESELIDIFNVCHTSEEIKYEVPFVPNLNGDTAIHLCIENEDFKSIDTILRCLKFYPPDHHSRGISNLYKDFIQQDLPEFLNYLDSRLKTNEQLLSINKGCLKEDSIGIITCPLWFEEKEVKDKLMMKKPVETRIRLEFLDMPGVYHFLDKNFDGFFDQLAGTENINFFSKKAIQKLIDFNYGVVREYVVQKLFIPFCFFMAFFFIFMNFVFENKNEDPIYTSLYYILASLLVCFATYFVLNEFKQLKEEGLDYLASFWNYIDLIPPFGIYTMVIMFTLKEWDIVSFRDDFTRTVLAIVTFFMWFKFLYFLRIFRSTGYLIRMIVEVIKDMQYFFLVLLITIAAFGDSMLIISLGNKNILDADGNPTTFTDGFIDSCIYTYRMILGDFDTSAFGSVATPVVMILFLLCTIFNMIVMLNLLIAIISDSYARVTANSELTTYQERASMVAENAYLVPLEVKKSYGQQNRFLLIVTDLEGNEEEVKKDPVMEKVKELRTVVDDKVTEIKSQITQVQNQNKETVEKLEAKFQASKEDVDSLKKTLAEVASAIQGLNSVQQQNQKDLTGRIISLASTIQKMNSGNSGAIQVEEEEAKVEEQVEEPAELINKVMTKIHRHKLQELTLTQVQEIHTGRYKSWCCDGRKFNGCKGGRTGVNSSVGDEIYHCDKCSFDYCEDCFKAYGQTHEHELERITFGDLREKNHNYNSGWGCDGRQFRPCPSGSSASFNDVNGIVYHDPQCEFDLCTQCMEFYRINQ